MEVPTKREKVILNPRGPDMRKWRWVRMVALRLCLFYSFAVLVGCVYMAEDIIRIFTGSSTVSV